MKGGVATCPDGHRVGKSGGWGYVLEATPVKGDDGERKRRRLTKGGFADKGEAEQALSDLEESMRDGTYVGRSDIAVGEYLTRWAEGVDVRASTKASYESHVRLHIVPRIGNLLLQDLDRPAIKKMYAELAESGRIGVGPEKSGAGEPLSDVTVHHIHVTLHRALEDAVEDRLISRNPADRAHKAPKDSDRPEHNVWTESQVTDFLAHVREDRLYALWLLALTSGARRGELLGLKWRHLSLNAGTVTFVRQRSRQGGKVTEGPTKTGRGRRTVDVDVATVAALEEWAGVQMVERLEWAEAWEGSDDLVFTRENGAPLDPDGTSSRWNRHVRASGLDRITIHEARHTHATLLLKGGTPVHVVSKRLGHASEAFTLRQYAHVLPEQGREAATRFAEMIGLGS